MLLIYFIRDFWNVKKPKTYREKILYSPEKWIQIQKKMTSIYVCMTRLRTYILSIRLSQRLAFFIILILLLLLGDGDFRRCVHGTYVIITSSISLVK